MFSFYRDNARWLLGGFLLTLFSCFGQTFFISIWGSEIRRAFELTHGGFGVIYMLATLASAACLPFVGRLVDVTSVAVTATLVMVCLALAAFSMGFVTSLPFLVFTLFLLRLFGQGMMTHTAITAMGRWYSQNRGKAVSCATIGHQFSEAIMPLCFVFIATVVGWRQTWLIAGLCVLLIALPLVFALMRVERIPRSDVMQNEADAEVGRQWTRAEVLKDPLFWLTGIGVFSPAFIGTSIFFHQDYLLELNDWPRWIYDYSFAFMAMVTVVVSLLTGYGVDRYSAVRLLPLFMLPLGISCFILGSFTAPSAIAGFMFFLGLSYGMSSTLFGALWPEIYGTRHLGAMRAVIVSLMVFMSAAGPGVTGWLIDLGIDFTSQLMVMGVFCFCAVGLMFVASRQYILRNKQAHVI